MDRPGLARLAGALPGAEAAPGPAVVAEADPARFMAAFARAAAGGGPVFLADPAWPAPRRAAFDGVVRAAAARPEPAREGWLMIPSGGTGGRLKLARHDEATLGAAVGGFCSHLGVERVHAVGVLPLHHVSGLMGWMRCLLTGGDYVPWSWKRLEAGELPEFAGGQAWFLSLVPTQLQRLLAVPGAAGWLRRFRAVFVGGGPLWPGLAAAAARESLPLSPGYGMTETAAMVATLPPGAFLAGERSCGPALPHARLELTADGRVRVAGGSLFRGYWPEFRTEGALETEDLATIDAQGHLHLLGRRDAVIISGGKKVAPAELEAALRDSGEFGDVAVIGVPDAEWGERVVACHSAGAHPPDLEKVERLLASRLPAHSRPKQYLAVSPWPGNPQGKVDRTELLRRALE